MGDQGSLQKELILLLDWKVKGEPVELVVPENKVVFPNNRVISKGYIMPDSRRASPGQGEVIGYQRTLMETHLYNKPEVVSPS